ncbi:Panacea domain-containing protein [uncultured Alistipes sp.]|jgi:uncharacterized phage-associated protein|uniref:Panacea domain-containing protein n=1 Tax=Alistipes sp. TaxID=1872444 RepID=UPI0025E03BA6|nr:type II toxin-antitoxin system antitoxin SocA domain-containing protein [uncultured Alistipes sp.]
MPEFKYTSIDIAQMLRWQAYKTQNVLLNKTQLEKLLYITYGIYAALTGIRLCDEYPKAWPFGPVFPRVAKHVDLDVQPKEYMTKEYEADSDLKKAVDFVIKTYSHTTAKVLSAWSHEEDGPWYQTMYKVDEQGSKIESAWNAPIDFNLIKDYFNRKFVNP